MSNSLSVGDELAKAATALLNEMDPDTYLSGIAPLKLALEDWAMAKTLPSDIALRRAARYLNGRGNGNGCNEVKTLQRLVEAAQCQDTPKAYWAGQPYSPGNIDPVSGGPPHVVVDLPAFDGYLPHIVRELQAVFVQECEKAGIKVRTL